MTDAVVAPGSRSTPLIDALDAAPGIRVTVVLDERSAGFTALGLGVASGRPAVVVTTSGTAAVELHPAVVEAGQARVPLIAVTTDRPPELHHVGAPQTVEQAGLFGSVVRWAADPGVPEPGSAAAWRSLAARAVAESRTASAGPGPVHLNLPFREPLLGDAGAFEAPPGRPGRAPWHAVEPALSAAPAAAVVDLLQRHRGGRGIIVAGAGAAEGAGEVAAVLELAQSLQWPVLAEPRSGCRIPSPWVVSAADSILRTELAALVPDAVLRIGPPWASKVLNQWLAALPDDVPQIVVDRWGWPDPERRASHVSRTTADRLAAELTGTAAPGQASVWSRAWQVFEEVARSAIDGLLQTGGALDLSEPAVAHAAVATLLPGGTLLASSSMPVRDVEWYSPPRDGVRVVANRGANGIDGIVSTALGVGLADPDRPTTGLLGDLAFVYDAGALLWARDRPARLRLVVVDNNGGGIFSFLPQAASVGTERFERYWGTPHGLDLVALASAYGARAERISDRAQLDRFLAGPGQPGAEVAVVPSDRAANVAAHDRIHSAVADAVARAAKDAFT